MRVYISYREKKVKMDVLLTSSYYTALAKGI